MPRTMSQALRRRALATRAVLALLIGLPPTAVGLSAQAQPTEIATEFCGKDMAGNEIPILPVSHLSGGPKNLVVQGGLCQVVPDSTMANKGEWKFANVNVLTGGILEFVEKSQSETDFWARSIIIENGGKVIAGRASQPPAPIPGNSESGQLLQPVIATASGRAFGELGGRLRIHLYGADESKGVASYEAQGAPCRTGEPLDDNPPPNASPCGIPQDIWDNGSTVKTVLPGAFPPADGKLVQFKDYFYKYDALYRDGKADGRNRVGYFGYKSIGLSYGGSLELYGAKGALKPLADGETETPTSSGNSWVRLGTTLVPSVGDVTVNTLKLDRVPGADWAPAKWGAGDEIVVTTTDYLPSHSEQLTIEKIEGDTVTFRRSDCAAGQTTDGCPGVRWRHQGERYPLSTRLDKALGADGKPRLTIDKTLVEQGIETRAAVALLSRSITIMSEGDDANETFAQATARKSSYAFGGHMVVRQGFEKFQVQGVEFKQLGQGGRKGHYPVHFHMARGVPPGTWLKDSSINESMTRWVAIHSTHNLTLARNVGYLSIGHGFYLEDSTEIDNRFYSNIGIHARAAVDSDVNPRKIPGILVDNFARGDSFPVLSDGNHPAVFWITNNWNEFIGNAAVGAGTCGACYWVAPSYSEQNGHHGMKWEGYAALQKDSEFSGTVPLKAFYKNSCTSAMNSFMSINNTEPCLGVNSPAESEANALNMIPSLAPPSQDNADPPRTRDPDYYPKTGDVPHATHCNVAAIQVAGMPTAYDCSAAVVCTNKGEKCGVTVLDHYTTSFNWAAHNFAAIWLRQFWYLFDNSVISDVMTAGITFVSGGDYTKSSSPEGYWALASNSIFVGETQPGNPFAYSIGPTNTDSKLKCDNNTGNSCVVKSAGVSFQKSNWGVNQRFFSIYDGPNYQDSNAYLDIKTRDCSVDNNCIWSNSNTIGVRKDPSKTGNAACYSPHAAIAWKQPNGFYYPPAFHSTNLFFDNVDIRHYVIAPVFKPTQGLKGVTPVVTPPNFGQGGSYLTDSDRANTQYCYFPADGGLNNFTDVDRQTELNDDDGSLTGLNNTISVNEDMFFSAPVETAECKSNIGINPDLACNGQALPASYVPTARTSPYDYVTTVVVPDCNQAGVCGPAKDPPVFNQRVGPWSSDCGGPFCYGVPIYRQFLKGNQAAGTGEWAQWKANGCADNLGSPACRWPFLRMAGQATWQRSNLTANHGSYYIDTTVSQRTQENEDFTTEPGPHSINVFQAGKKYSLMFLFAKNSTKQTYKMHVGTRDAAVEPLRRDISTKATSFKSDDNASKWLDAKIVDGMLTINIDFAAATDLKPSKANGSCQPHTFCAMDASDNCVCSLPDDDPMVLANPGIKASCNRACSHWAMKDLDCPAAGCYAVGITMGSDFVADDVQRRPQPDPFPGPTVMSLSPGSGDRGWETLFSRTATLPDGKTGGTCHYDKVPGTAECLSPPN